jgi:hypothetical protein
MEGNVKIFGREPAMWAAAIGSLVSLFSAFVIHLTTDQAGAVNGIVSVALGLAVAAMTHDGLSAAILGVIKGLVLVALAWHLNISADNQAIIYIAASALVAMFVRTQATAKVPPPPDAIV